MQAQREGATLSWIVTALAGACVIWLLSRCRAGYLLRFQQHVRNNENVKAPTLSIQRNLNKWLWFVAETLVSAFVGDLIAFVFGSHYWASLSAFAILMLFVVLLAVVLIVFENKV